MTRVVAALLWKDERFLICQRPEYKARGGLWEFVGGKIEPGESPRQALIRECREELDIEIAVGEPFCTVMHQYPDLTVELTVYHTTLISGSVKLLEHQAIAYILPEEIDRYDFCPADVEILAKIKKEGGNLWKRA